jgi:murein tripeptide amidase MpaA
MGYLTVPQINTAITRLAADHAGICERIALPEATYEGRATFALRIGTRSPWRSGFLDPIRLVPRPPGVLFLCGVHARERGGPEIAIAFAADLLWAYERGQGLRYGGKEFSASDVEAIVERLNVFVVPMVNPDGVHHVVQNPGSNWRKNRNPADGGGNPGCYGVDINRNFPFLWDFPKHFAPGVAPASINPCAETYRGSGPASEPETRNVRWLLDRYPSIGRMMDIHSWRRRVLHLWGDDENQSADPSMSFLNPAWDGRRGLEDGPVYREFIPAADRFAVVTVAARVRDAINAVRGERYTAIQSIALDVDGTDWYPTSGASDDYSYSRHLAEPGKSKVYGFTLEFGTEFHPPWAEMESIILDVNAGMLEFCLAAVPPADPFPEYSEWRRLFRWQTLVPVLGLAALAGGAWLAGRALAAARRPGA